MNNISYDEAMFEFLEPHIGHDLKCDEWDADGLVGVSIWCDTCGLTLSSGEKAIKVETKKFREIVMKCPCCNKVQHVSQGDAMSCAKCEIPLINPFLQPADIAAVVRT